MEYRDIAPLMHPDPPIENGQDLSGAGTDAAMQRALSDANESVFEWNGWHKLIGDVPESLPTDVSVGTILTVAWPKPFVNGRVFFYRQGTVTPLTRRWREYRVYTRTEQRWQRDHMEFA